MAYWRTLKNPNRRGHATRFAQASNDVEKNEEQERDDLMGGAVVNRQFVYAIYTAMNEERLAVWATRSGTWMRFYLFWLQVRNAKAKDLSERQLAWIETSLIKLCDIKNEPLPVKRYTVNPKNLTQS